MKLNKLCKRVLSVTLAAALAVGTPIAAAPQAAKAAVAGSEKVVEVTKSMDELNDVVDAPGWWTGWSDYYKVSGNFDVKFNMTLGSDPAQNYNTPSVVITSNVDRAGDGYVEYSLRRSDATGWCTEGAGAANEDVEITKRWEEADEANNISAVEGDDFWATWRSLMSTGNKYSIAVKKAGTKFTITHTLVADGKTYNEIEIFEYETPKDIRIFFAGDTSKFTIDSLEWTELPAIKSVAISAEGSDAKGTAEDPVVVKNVHYYTDDKNTGAKLGEVQLKAAITPEDAVDPEVEWSLSEGAPAVIDAETGKITLTDDVPEKDGSTFTAIATAKANKDIKAECTIKAEVDVEKVVGVTSVSAENQTLYMGYDANGDLKVGQSVSPVAKVEPSDATIKDVYFELVSGDAVTIDKEGKTITAVQPGTATVKVISASNKDVYKEFTVTVSKYEFGKAASDFTTTGYLTKGTPYDKVSEDFSVEYNFDSKTFGSDNWTNFVFEIIGMDADNKALGSQIYRADAWSDKAELGEASWTTSVTDWAAFVSDMKKGSNVTIKVTKEGSKLTVSYYINGSSQNEYYMSAVATLEEEPSYLLMRVSGNNCECTNFKVAPSNQNLELGIGGSKDYDVTKIVPGAETITDAVSSDATVATTDPKGSIVTVTGVKTGTATITVTADNGMTFEIKVNVSDDSAAPAPSTSPAPSQDPGTASGPAVTPGEPTQAPTTTDTPGSSDTPGTTPSEPTPTPGDNDDNTGNTGDDEKK